MDRRVYILPIASVFIVIALLMRADVTGYMTAYTFGNEISADISVTINDGGLIPGDSMITVYLDDQSASMPFREFVENTGKGKSVMRGEISEIGYSGFGYAGTYTYILPVSGFGLNLRVEPGEHTIITEVSYENFVISRDEQTIET